MLETIRQGSKSPFIKVIVFAIVVAFAFFGVESVVSINANNGPAEINGQNVTQQTYSRYVNQSLETEAQRQQAIQQMVNDILIQQQADSLGMSLSDRAIAQQLASEEAFQDENGEFDPNIYRLAIGNAGYTPIMFREYIRDVTAGQHLRFALAASDFAVYADSEALIRLQDQTRDFNIKRFAPSDFDVDVTEEEIAEFYANNETRYIKAEQAQASFVELTLDDVASDVVVPEVDVQARYDAYVENNLESRFAHILLDGDDAQARANELLAQLNNGADFGQLAQENSIDTFSAENGGELSVVPEGEFEDAVNRLTEVGELDIVTTEFGTHIITLLGDNRDQLDTFEERRAAIEAQIQREESGLLFAERREQFADVAFTALDLAEVAEAFDLDIQTVEPFTATEGTGVASNEVFRNAAFSQISRDGQISELIEIADDRVAVLFVNEFIPEFVQPLDDVREQIVTTLTNQKRNAAAEAAAQEALEVAKTTPLDEREGWTSEPDVTRTSQSVDFLVNQAVFALPEPTDEPLYRVFRGIDASFYAVELTEVTPGEVDPQQAESQLPFLANANGEQSYTEWFGFQLDNAEVRIRQ
ncbi:SurA N-terminal domain-containing protein [Salinibius halmophilus]|uniref:SurA N-terminal domain-containing protein n=1 Tax=Salinibius halmophilus TaxID=1853216 RepID=UPI000E66061E|nr:SurA N-terminal domain-containing protein [Salinibius halmophilus]